MTITDETVAAAVGRITDDYAATAPRTMNPVMGTILLLREANAEDFASPAYLEKSQEALDYAMAGLETLDPDSKDAKVLADAIAKLARFLSNDWSEFDGPDEPPVTAVNWLTSMTASGDECVPCAEAAAETETFQSTPIAVTTDADSDDDRIPTHARWEGPIGFENQMTGDGRFLEEGSLRWDGLPLPLRYVSQDVGAHDGAQVGANIDTIERLAPLEDGSIPIWGSGDIDMASPVGREVYRQLKGGWTTGVSMDLDDVTFEIHAKAELVNSMMEGGGPSVDDMAEDSEGRLIAHTSAPDDEVSVTTDGRIRAATIVAIPAFANARLSLVASGMTFSPDQARAPEGTSIGGQWIDTPSGLLKSTRSGVPLTKVVAKVKEDGGASINPVTLEEPTDGYMVAVQGHNVEVPAEEFFGGGGEAALGKWMEDNREALSQPGAHIGLWHDTEHGEVVMDVSQRVDTAEEAIALGQERNQQAVWDVAAGEEIPTGGTGDRGTAGSDEENLSVRARGVLRVDGRGEAGLAGRGREASGPRGGTDRVTFASPDQARAPEGTPIGGQWIDTPTGLLKSAKSVDTSGGGGAAPAEDEVPIQGPPRGGDIPDGGGEPGGSTGSLGESVELSEGDMRKLAASPISAAHIDENGEWTKERKEFHDQLVASYLDPVAPPKGQPTLYMNGGGPGAGKSSMTKGVNAALTAYPSTRGINDMTGEFDPMTNPGAVLLDPDAVKIQLPEVAKMREAQQAAMNANFDAGEYNGWAQMSHEESSYLTKRIYQGALDRGLNVVYDGTGDGGIDSVLKKVNQAREKGYRAEANYLYLEPKTGLQRATERGERTGRIVPPHVQAEVYQGLPAVVDYVDNGDVFDVLRVFDNNVPDGSPARLIGESTTGGPITVYDQEAYNRFMSSGERVGS